MNVPAPAAHQHQRLLNELEQFARSATQRDALMQRLSDRLHAEMARFNWVGFYLVDRVEAEVLLLGPFTGSFTPHERIAFSEGLCGEAASSGHTVVVNDVSIDAHYLQGSGQTKSEMVAPILAARKLVGVLDVNSYFAGTFGNADRQFVEACAALVGKFFERPAG